MGLVRRHGRLLLFAGGFLSRTSRLPGSRDEVSRPKRNGVRVGIDRDRDGAGADRHAGYDRDRGSHFRVRCEPLRHAGCGRVIPDRLRRQSGACPPPHLAAGCPLPGAQRDQRHAVRRGHRNRFDRHVARAGCVNRLCAFLGHPVDGIRGVEYFIRQSFSSTANCGETPVGIFELESHWLYPDRHWDRSLFRR